MTLGFLFVSRIPRDGIEGACCWWFSQLPGLYSCRTVDRMFCMQEEDAHGSPAPSGSLRVSSTSHSPRPAVGRRPLLGFLVGPYSTYFLPESPLHGLVISFFLFLFELRFIQSFAFRVQMLEKQMSKFMRYDSDFRVYA